MSTRLAGLAVIAATLLFANVASARVAFDWDPAFFWQTGATPYDAPAGGELKAVGIISDFGPPFDFLDADDPAKEYTFYIYGLISQGTVATGPPTTTFYLTEYTGGFIEIYEGSPRNSSFAPNPPNALVPSTYVDGTLILSGYFTSFQTQTNNFSQFSVGNAEGMIIFNGGTLLSVWTNNVGDAECPGLFNGGTTWNPSTLPAGYLFRHDGKLDLNCKDQGDLDIHPTSCPNPVNTGSKGLTPVALLGSETFDISQVELSSLRLEGLAPEVIALGDVSRPVEGGEDVCDCTTEGPDGYDDLLLKFDTQKLLGLLEPVKPGETRVLTLTGNLYENGFIQTFEASDCVWLKGDGVTTAPTTVALEVTMPGAGLVPARIDYSLAASGPVQISVLDVSGRTVARVLNAWGQAGAHTIEWAPRGLPSGIYFVRMVAGDETRVRRVAIAH